jgi:hypothetical protein
MKKEAAQMYSLKRQKNFSELMSENSKNSRRLDSNFELKSLGSQPRIPVKVNDYSDPVK